MFEKPGVVIIIFSIYKGSFDDHLISNVAGGKTIRLRKTNFSDTGICQTIINIIIRIIIYKNKCIKYDALRK